MRTNGKPRLIGGITLIEALIAIAIVSIGLLAIARLHGELMAAAGDSKARAEAMQIAETQFEKLRNVSTLEGLEGRITELMDAPDPKGKNAEFTLSWAGTAIQADDSFSPRLTVSWENSRGDTQSVVLDTTIAWTNPRVSVAATDPDTSGGNFVERPTGRARMGLPDEAPSDEASLVRTNDDGTEIWSDGEGTVQLVGKDDSGQQVVLLSMETTNPDEWFSTISGRVYVDDAHKLGTGINDLDPFRTRVVSSDAAECIRYNFESESADSVELKYDNATGHHYFDYNCYFGEGWYGNIGILRLDEARNRDQVCVGDPAVLPNEDLWSSREPFLSYLRQYRGFYEVLGERTQVAGIGVHPDSREYHAVEFEDHDFLLSPIGNNANNEDCISYLQEVPGGSTGNPGRHVCLLDAVDGHSKGCVGVADPVVVTTTIIVEIEEKGQGQNQPELFGITMEDGVTCGDESQGNTILYRCELKHPGEGLTSWGDRMELDLGNETHLCGPASHTFTDHHGNSYGEMTMSGNGFDFTEMTRFGEILDDIPEIVIAHKDVGC